MSKVKDILNKVGDFEIHLDSQSLKIQGVLLKDQNIVLHGRIELKDLGLISNFIRPRITGIVDGIEVTLFDPMISSVTRHQKIGKEINDSEYTRMFAESTEIIIGRRVLDEGNIVAAEMDLLELNWFFEDKVFNHSMDAEMGSLVLLRYQFPETISAEDEDGRLKIDRRLSSSPRFTDLTFSSTPFIRFEFMKAVSFRGAVEKMAKIRNLFLFLANDYLPLRDIRLTDEVSKTYDDSINPCDFLLVLNDKHEEKNPCSRPFYISSNFISEDFGDIWKKWCDLNEHKFIIGLFYQIISDRSIWTNRFLNFSQAIELYERTYRLPHLLKSNGRPYFKSCISDAMTQLKELLEFEDNRIDILAEAIKEARNYFTHYNPEIREPSFDKVSAMGHILHLTYLGLIYQHLGLNLEVIGEIKHKAEFKNFDNTVRIALGEEVSKKEYFF